MDTADKQTLGIHEPDKTHTPRPDPTDLVEFTISTIPTDHRVIANFFIAGSKSHSKGSYHAAEIRFWVREPSDPAPQDPDETGWHSEADTRSPWEKTFLGTDKGKNLYIMMRWENSATGTKGKGPWGAMATVVIP